MYFKDNPVLRLKRSEIQRISQMHLEMQITEDYISKSKEFGNKSLTTEVVKDFTGKGIEKKRDYLYNLDQSKKSEPRLKSSSVSDKLKIAILSSIDKLEDKLLLTAPIAKDGHCPRVMFQIPVKDAVNYGRYDVFLLDTRVVSSADDKKIVPRTDAKLVNGYGRVHAEITLSAFSNKSEGSVVANMNSAAPKDAMQPRVKSMRIVGDQVILEVENIPGFMRVQSGRDTSAADSTGVALETPENSDTVTLIAPKTGDKGFYRVIHNPSK
jgi:hypothetical protein